MKLKHLQKLEEICNVAIKHIKKDDFLSARPLTLESMFIEKRVLELLDTKKPDGDEKEIAKKMLKIARSFYQYAHRPDALLIPRFMSNELYDALVKKYDASGTYEGAYVPEDLKKKTAEYQELTSNLDKAYRLHDDDIIPDGVKEKYSVEDFINDVMKECGIDKKEEFEIEMTPKIDGVSINSAKSGDHFKSVLSRGDVKTKGKDKDKESSVIIAGLEGKLDSFSLNDEAGPKNFGIAWELFVTRKGKKEIEKIFGGEGNEYKSLRSTVAGVQSRLFKDKDNLAKDLFKHLSFYPTMAAGHDMKFADMRAHLLENYSNIPADMIEPVYIKGTKKELLVKIQEFYKEALEKRSSLSYDIDGIVITVTKKSYQDKLGRTGRKNQYQLAYKFTPGHDFGVVIGNTVDIGMFGKVTRKITFEQPVVIQDTAYPFAVVAREEDFDKMDLRVGDKVKVVRTGDVMPSISVEDTIKLNQDTPRTETKLTKTMHCPWCGSRFTKRGESKNYFCNHSTCQGRSIGKIQNIVDVLNIEGISIGFAEKAYKHGVRNIQDIYNLTKEDLEKMGYKSQVGRFIKDLRSSIEEMPAYALIDALGIDQLRSQRAKNILLNISLKDILSMELYTLVDAIKQVPKIDSYAVSFASDLFANRDVLKAMLPIIQDAEDNFEPRYTIAASGFRFSKKEEKQLRERGYEVVDTKKFDVLVTDKTDGGKYDAWEKNQSSRTLLTVAEFEAILKEGGEFVKSKS